MYHMFVAFLDRESAIEFYSLKIKEYLTSFMSPAYAFIALFKKSNSDFLMSYL